MQINGYSNNIFPYSNLNSQDRTKNVKNLSERVQGTSREDIETSKLTAKEEMEVFKKEIYNEISQIYSKGSSAILSNSIHVTDEALEKMKNDPEFRNKVMNTFSKDAAASHLLPYETRITTTITEDGVYSYGANVYPQDSAEAKSAKKDEADKKAEGAFYRYERENRDNSINHYKIWLQEKEKREMLYEMQFERALSQQAPAKEGLYKKMYMNGFLMGDSTKTWNA